MKLFEPVVCDGYEWINACDDGDYETFLRFDGRPLQQSWRPIRVRRVRADDRQAFKESDFPWLGSHALVMRRRAVDALAECLSSSEVLPLTTDDGVELFVLNATVIDALDRNLSSVMTFPGSDRIMRISKPVFVASRIRDVDVFRLPHRASPTYVSVGFVERVMETRLRGLDFNEVWSS